MILLSAFSLFRHVYILSCLFQPAQTLDITLQFIHQTQELVTQTNVAEKQVGYEKYVTLIARAMQTLFSAGILLARTFVLLSILFIMSTVDAFQLYRRVLIISNNKSIIAMTRITKDENIPSRLNATTITPTTPSTITNEAETVVMIAHASNINNADNISTSTTFSTTDLPPSVHSADCSPRLLPTPPSEEQKMNDNDLLLINHNHSWSENLVQPITTTSLSEVPSEPTPPDIDNNLKSEDVFDPHKQTDNNTNQSVHISADKQSPTIEKATVPSSLSASEPVYKSDFEVDATITPILNEHTHNSSDSTIQQVAFSKSASLPLSSSSQLLSSSSPLSSSDDTDITQQKQRQQEPKSDHETGSSVHRPASPDISSPDMPTDAPKQSDVATFVDDDIRVSMPLEKHVDINDDITNNNIPVISSPSPSTSISSSLSTLHPPKEGITPPMPDKSNSRFHQAFIQKQQQLQQEQQQEKQKEEKQLPRPLQQSVSSRTHHSLVSTTPAPTGSSLSMKLSKLKQPGRRISQLFKRKSKKVKE